MKRIRIIEYRAWRHAITGLRNRLFLPNYSGSGLLLFCGGRERTIAAAASTRRTVSSDTRMPVRSAI
jgi:hypothetical protein